MRRWLVGAFMAFAGPAFAQATLPIDDVAAPSAADWTVVPVQPAAPCSHEETYWQCFSRFRPHLPPGNGASVSIRFTVGADGRVSSCARNRQEEQTALGVGACAFVATQSFSPPAVPDTPYYRTYDWGAEDIPPEALTRPAAEAVLIQTGYVRTMANGLEDPCHLLVCETDYPPGARLREAEGSVIYHVLVSAQGQPKSCWISRPTTSDDLNKATCPVIMARARFAPARDSSGADRISVYSGVMRWTLAD